MSWRIYKQRETRGLKIDECDFILGFVTAMSANLTRAFSFLAREWQTEAISKEWLDVMAEYLARKLRIIGPRFFSPQFTGREDYQVGRMVGIFRKCHHPSK